MKKKDIRQYYSMPRAALSERDDKILNHLIATHLRQFAMECTFWERDKDDTKPGLFEVCDPYDQAEHLIATLQLYGFISDLEPEVSP